jgi:hypothetical protein
MGESGQTERVVKRTAEQREAVRRRALPVGAAGTVLGLAAVGLAARVHVTAFVPPSLLAVNLAFCAMLIGAGILFYARGTPGTRVARALSLAALLLGMIGTLQFTWQAVQSRLAREALELANVRAVARAAAEYAGAHEGIYPSDLLVLLEEGRLEPQTLQSPYGAWHPLFEELAQTRDGATRPAAPLAAAPRAELLRSVETASDYLYLGGDLKNVPPDAAGAILVAVSANTVLRVSLAAAFADGTSRFLTPDEVPAVIARCNAARKKMGLGDLRPPAILQSALDQVKAPPPQ